MNANEYKSNTGKLLAAVLAMIMIITCAAVVLSDNSSVDAQVPEKDPFSIPDDVTGYEYDKATGAINITDDVTITLTKDVGSTTNPLDVYFNLTPGVTLEITGDYSIYINNIVTSTTDAFVLTQSTTTPADGTTALVILTGGVDAHFATQKDDNIGVNNHVVKGVSVTIEEQSTLTLSQTGTYSSGVAYWNQNSPTLTIDSSTLVLDNAGGIGAKIVMNNSTIDVKNPKSGDAYIALDAGSTIVNSEINATNANDSRLGVQIQSAGTDEGTAVTKITNSEITITSVNGKEQNAVFQLADGANLDATGSTITAPTINVRNNWGQGDTDAISANVTGGTLIGNLTGSSTNSNTLNISGATVGELDGNSTVSNNLTVMVPYSENPTTLYLTNSGAVSINGPVKGSITNAINGTTTVAPEYYDETVMSGAKTEYNLLANVDAGITSGNGWSYDVATKTLTLDGFDGEGYFYYGDMTNVIVLTDSEITVPGDAIAAVSTQCLGAIRNNGSAALAIDGPGELTISMTAPETYNSTTNKIVGIMGGSVTVNTNITVSGTGFEGDSFTGKTFQGIRGHTANVIINRTVNGDIYGSTEVTVNGTVVGDIGSALKVTANGATITGDISTATLELTDSTVVSGTVDATTSITMTKSEFATTNVEGAKITTPSLTMDVASIDDTYELNVSTTISINGNAYVPEITGEPSVVVDEDSTVILVNYKGAKPNGTVIITGEFNYTGNSQIIVYNGVSQQVAVGQIYLADGAKIVDNTNVVTVDAQNPVSGNIATTVDKANEYIDSGEDVAILSTAPVNISGLHNEAVTVTVGTAYGTLGTENDYFIGTIVSNNLGCVAGALTINGVMFGTDPVVSPSTAGTGVTGTGMSVTGGQDIEGDSIVTVVGSKISGKITGNGVYVELKGVNAGTEGFTVKAGSVVINGTISFAGEDAGIVSNYIPAQDKDGLVLVNAEITGKGTIDVNDLRIIGDVTIGENVTIFVDSGAEFTIDDGAVLGGDGTVKVEGTGILVNNGTIENTVTVLVQDYITVDTMDEFITALEYYDTIYIAGDTTGALIWNSTDRNVVIDVSKKTVWIGKDEVSTALTIGENVTLNLIESTVNSVGSSTLTFDEKSTFGINDSDVYMNVKMDEKATLNLENNVTDITGASTRLDSVGFGKVINFSNNYNLSSDTNLNVWGTINVNEGYTLTIASGNSITIEESGQMTIDGTLVVNGTITVKNNGDLDSNLQINGVIDMNGTMDGKIDNYGTVDIDGKSDNSTIAMYDGAVLNATSVDGILSVIGFSDVRDPVNTAAGKETHYTIGAVTLQNVKGVSITASETYTAASGSGENYKNAQVVVTLDISGNAKANTQAVTEQSPAEIGFTGMAIKMVSGVISNLADPKTMPVTVVNTLDVDNGIALAIDDSADAFVLAGTLNIAVGATIGCGTDVFVDGELSVSAVSVRALDSAITGKENINAAYTTKTTDAVGTTPAYVTRTYTTLANAIEDAPAADDPVVFISGTVEVAEGTTVTVPAGVTVSNRDGAGTIDVKGTLVFDNFMESYIPVTGDGIEADVRIDADPARTYTTLANAIDMGVTDIVLNGDVEITSDLTIPAGVTVSSDEFGITVKTEYDEGKERNVTLTVEGAVLLTGEETAAGEPTNGIVLVGSADYDARLVVAGEDGHVQVIDDVAGLSGVAGAHYYSTVDNEKVYIVSTLMHAAADSTNVVSDNNGKYTITVKGQITVDSLEFTAPENAADVSPLIIEVEDIDVKNQSSLRFSEIVLGQNVMFGSDDAELTGAVVMQNDEGALVSEVDLNRAVGIFVYVHEEPETDDAPAYDCMEISGYVTAGTVTIAAGTVSVDTYYEVDYGTFNGDKYSGNLVIAQGATLSVPEDSVLYIWSNDADATAMTVEGTLVIEGYADIDGAQIDGTVTVKSDDVDVANVTVNGTVDVVEEENENNVLTVYGPVTVGSKPTQLGTAAGTGTISGAVTFDEDPYYDDVYIKAYPGSDMTGAKVNWDDVNEESEALSTVFNINGETYMTVYVNAGDDMPVYLVLAMEKFELVGLFNGLNYVKADAPDYNDNNTGLYKISNWYTSESMLENQKLDAGNAVGDYATVYAYAEPATITGTLSVGLGIQFYVDDVPVNNDVGRDYELGVGAHTVRYEIQGGYNGDKVTITFNGQTVQNGGVVTVTANDNTFTLAVSGAEYVGSGGDVVVNPPEVVVNNQSNDDMSLTDILLIVLVILIVIMAIIVALRMMRS